MSDSQGPNRSVSLEPVACALCGAEESEKVLQGHDTRRRLPGTFSVVRCHRCGLAYVSPRPTPSGIAQFYPQDYIPHDRSAPSLAEKLYYRVFRRLPAAPHARVLDVGCGGGKYLRVLRQEGYEVEGLEVNTEVARALRGQLGIRIHEGTLTHTALAPESFDVVTFWWVLEHTHDPLENLRAAHRILKPGGTLIVALQNFASLGRLLFGAHWHHLDLPGHLYQFEPRTLCAALEKCGFEVRRIRQDLVAKDFAPSLGYALGLDSSLDRTLLNLLALPFDLLAWVLRRSGLMTIYAWRN